MQQNAGHIGKGHNEAEFDFVQSEHDTGERVQLRKQAPPWYTLRADGSRRLSNASHIATPDIGLHPHRSSRLHQRTSEEALRPWNQLGRRVWGKSIKGFGFSGGTRELRLRIESVTDKRVGSQGFKRVPGTGVLGQFCALQVGGKCR